MWGFYSIFHDIYCSQWKYLSYFEHGRAKRSTISITKLPAVATMEPVTFFTCDMHAILQHHNVRNCYTLRLFMQNEQTTIYSYVVKVII